MRLFLGLSSAWQSFEEIGKHDAAVESSSLSEVSMKGTLFLDIYKFVAKSVVSTLEMKAPSLWRAYDTLPFHSGSILCLSSAMC